MTGVTQALNVTLTIQSVVVDGTDLTQGDGFGVEVFVGKAFSFF